MLTMPLRLLLLAWLCSPELLATVSSHSSEEGSTYDFRRYQGPPPAQEGSSGSEEEPPAWPGSMPRAPPGPLWPPGDNVTDGPIDFQHTDADGHMTYCDHLMNAPVPPPASQIPFFCICSYCKGTVGAKGTRGDRGRPGLPGSPGPRGMVGFKGHRGFTGPGGIKGQKGDQGEKGQLGEPGLVGPKGRRGFKGEKGDQGPGGVQGPQGPQGQTGVCPASCRSVPGPPGEQGPPGPAGGRGLPGLKGLVGSKGAKGAKGDLGRTGDPGVNGEKGDRGEQGVCECTDGTDGADGQPGVTGAKGAQGDPGVQGVQGAVGPQGTKGDMGFRGPPGPCRGPIQSAFSASLNESFPRKNWPVAFHRVLSNQQGHFNASMGTYSAPVHGTYVFSFHLSVAVKPLKVGIFRNFQPVLKKTEVQSPSTTSQQLVLHLQRTDRVWLQVKDEQTNGMYAGAESSSTFSGYLLFPDSCELPLGREFGGQEPPPSGEYSWDGSRTTSTPPP